MKKGQDTRGYERYMALDIHREYILVGAWNEKKDWVVSPRRAGAVWLSRFGRQNTTDSMESQEFHLSI
jgi:hypothetical protein